ncbi:MAG: hypothetical protein JJU28_03085 [Cyclobacteriaceae bacterium]|nr:hypothetical protein [Cyclobacteriaceae bacterium]
MSAKQSKRKIVKTEKVEPQIQQVVQHKAFHQKLDYFLEKRVDIFLYIFSGLWVLLSILFFDPKVSIGGDDSEYISRAYEFYEKGVFPSFQGPLYPIVLSILYAVAGLQIIVFKVFSIFFYFVHLWFFYKLLKKHLPLHLTAMIMLILSINAVLLEYTGTTYAEAIFLMLQAIYLYCFDKYILSETKETSLKSYLYYGIIAFLLFLMFITKNIGLAAFAGTFLFLIVSKQWKPLIIISSCYFLFIISFETGKRLIWEYDAVQISSQGSTLLNKHPYDASQGQENLKGFIMRFVQNSDDYLSRHFLEINGIRYNSKKTIPLVSLFIYVLIAAGLLLSFRKNAFWFFTGIYTLTGIGIIFIVLQTYWSQDRLILAYFPVLLAFLLYASYTLLVKKFGNNWIYLIVLFLFLGGNIIKTIALSPEKYTAMKQYIKGDNLYGFTPDWINLIKMSQWAAKNLPEDAFIASRKPGVSFIYTQGKEFFGIWNVPSEDPDELYKLLKDAGVTHVIMASLRVLPDRKTDRVINTIHRYLGIIYEKYPEKIEIVHVIGEDEKAFLYAIK